MGRPRNTIDSVLYRLIIQEDGCWIWPGDKNTGGYGKVKFNTVTSRVHRVVYEHFFGKIPEGLQTDHLCKNILCANPWHLELVSARENWYRSMSQSAVNERKMHCIRGHPLSGDNLYVYAKTGKRHCRQCAHDQYKAKYVPKADR
jgi:hypothetical protein